MTKTAPVVQEAFEVLEEKILVLVDEAFHAVRHVACVVDHAEVPVVLETLVIRLDLVEVGVQVWCDFV